MIFYNNLKVYVPEVKGCLVKLRTQDYGFSPLQNNNTRSSKEAVNAAHGVTTTSTKVNTAYSTNIDNLSDDVICSFFARSLLLMAMRLLVLISPKWSATTATRGDILLRSAELQEIKTTRTRKAQEGSDQAEEGPNYALIAYSSSSSGSEVLKEASRISCPALQTFNLNQSFLQSFELLLWPLD
ncbi:hypothetical protein Tco_0405758 [Tanacetum coccineum]